MSFGTSVGDIIVVGGIVKKLAQDYKDAPESFKNISSELSSGRAVLEALDEILAGPNLSTSQKTRLATIRSGFDSTVNDLQAIVDKHKSLGSPNKRAKERITWPHKHIPELRDRLHSNSALINTFLNISPIRIDGEITALVKELRDAKHRLVVTIGQATESPSIEQGQTTPNTGKELIDVRITEVELDAGEVVLERSNRAPSSESSGDQSLDSDSRSTRDREDSGSNEVDTRGTAAPRSSAQRESDFDLPTALAMSWAQPNAQVSRPNSTQTDSTVDTNQDPVFDPASTSRSARPSSISQTTIPSGRPSLASLDRTQPGSNKVNVKFIEAAKKGDTALLLSWVTKEAGRSQLGQESVDTALIELSKNAKHGSQRLETVIALLDKCAPNVECRDPDYDRTTLMWAAYFGHDAIADLLIGKEASLRTVDRTFQRTPLMWAAKRGALKVVNLLLDYIQDQQLIDAKDIYGSTALALAYAEKHPEPAKTLLEHKANPNCNICTGSPLLVSAVMQGDEYFVRLLLEHNADVNCVDLDEIPVLSIAVFDQPLSMIELLINKGANIQTSDAKGRTPLIWAIKRFHVNIVDLLIKKGANKNVKDNDGYSAQYWAKRSRRKRIIELVCQAD